LIIPETQPSPLTLLACKKNELILFYKLVWAGLAFDLLGKRLAEKEICICMGRYWPCNLTVEVQVVFILGIFFFRTGLTSFFPFTGIDVDQARGLEERVMLEDAQSWTNSKTINEIKDKSGIFWQLKQSLMYM